MPQTQDFQWYGPDSTTIYDSKATEEFSGTPDIAVCSLDTRYPMLWHLIKWLVDMTVRNPRSHYQ